MSEGASPMRFMEHHVYTYLVRLEGNAGAASGSHLIEALRFLDATVGFVHVSMEDILSSRYRGLAQQMHASKAPLKQKAPLTSLQVENLGRFIVTASSRHACVAGQLLFCFHSGSRWRDSQSLRSLTLEEDDDACLVLLRWVYSILACIFPACVRQQLTVSARHSCVCACESGLANLDRPSS